MDKLIAAAEAKNDTVLITTGLMLVGKSTKEARMVSAAVTEVLIRRHPEVAEAVKAWSDDLDNEMELIDLLVLEIAA